MVGHFDGPDVRHWLCAAGESSESRARHRVVANAVGSCVVADSVFGCVAVFAASSVLESKAVVVVVALGHCRAHNDCFVRIFWVILNFLDIRFLHI